MAAAGLSQTDLAKTVGVSQQAIGKIISGETSKSGYLHKIAHALGTTPAYLTGETDDPALGAALLPSTAVIVDRLDLVAVHEIDLAFGLGGTYLDSGHVQEKVIHFPRAWLRQFTAADPAMLVFARGDGDSMAPTINDHDIVLIDRTHTSINRQDRIWAMAYGEIGMIKRVRAMPDGSYKLMSDNPAVEAEFAVDGELHVFGRVVARMNGL